MPADMKHTKKYKAPGLLKPLREYRSGRKFFLLLAVVTSLLFFLLFVYTPMEIDDYWYAIYASKLDLSWARAAVIWQNCMSHLLYDTGRLANLLAPIFLGLLPKWVFSAISAFLIFFSIRESCRIAGTGAGGTGSYVILIGFIFFLPWLDYASSVIFPLNYLWSSAIDLLIIYWFFDEKCSASPTSFTKLLGMGLTAMAAGWMHEGFSVSVIGGFGVILLIDVCRNGFSYLWKEGAIRFVLTICFMIGTILIVTTPAFSARLASGESNFIKFSLTERLLHGIGFNLLYYCFICCYLARVIRSMVRDNCRIAATRKNRLLLFIAVAGAVGTVLFFRNYTGPRMGWWNTALSAIGLAAIVSDIRVESMAHGKLHAVFKWGVTSVIIFHMSYAVAEQRRLYRESEEITALYLASDDGQVFYDNTPFGLTPSLFKTSMRNFNETAPLHTFSAYWKGWSRPMLRLIPTRLKNFSPDRLTPCKSDSSLYLFDGLLVSRDSAIYGHTKVMVEISSSGWTESRMRLLEFYPPSDDAEDDVTPYIILIPHAAVMFESNVCDAYLK